jgi:hypothetical protein
VVDVDDDSDNDDNGNALVRSIACKMLLRNSTEH